MAQVKFFGMLLDFQFVLENYKKEQFSKFIFQPYLQDSTQDVEEYYLTVYAMDSRGEVMERIDLSVKKEDSYDAPRRLDIGNIALTRLQVEPFIKEQPSYLYLSPVAYGDYVAYNVTGMPAESSVETSTAQPRSPKPGNVELEIKPSPPAPPEP